MIDTGEGGTGPGKDVERSKMSLMIQPDTRDEAINASDQAFHYDRACPEKMKQLENLKKMHAYYLVNTLILVVNVNM